MTSQGWDRADYSCGRCLHTFTATTEPEYLAAHLVHQTAHEIADGLLAMPHVLDQVLQLLRPTD